MSDEYYRQRKSTKIRDYRRRGVSFIADSSDSIFTDSEGFQTGKKGKQAKKSTENSFEILSSSDFEYIFKEQNDDVSRYI